MYYKIGIIHGVHVHSSLQEELLKLVGRRTQTFTIIDQEKQNFEQIYI